MSPTSDWPVVAQPTVPWLRRAVTRSQMVSTILLAAVLWLGGVMAAGLWLQAHWQGQVQLVEQAVALSLPDRMRASADVTSPVETRLKARPVVMVPLDQVVSVRVPDTITGSTRIEASVPIDTEVIYQADVPVNTEVTANVPVVSWLPSMTVTLPLAFTVPVHLTVPFKREIKVALDIQASADLPDELRLPVRTSLPLTVPLDQPVTAQVLSRTQFELRATEQGIPVTVVSTRLDMPLKNLQLVRQP